VPYTVREPISPAKGTQSTQAKPTVMDIDDFEIRRDSNEELTKY